uniref:PNPLA domain-containing protein n=1 Tax=viral metagenome TaxID=1070528 RepID=A0A6C0IWS1_9ZZZZ
MVDITKLRGIALEGGGVAGIGHGGAVNIIDKIGVYRQLTHFAGSSAGSMVAALMACRIPTDKLKEILLEFDFRLLEDNSWFVGQDIYRLWSEYGWNRGQAIEEVFGQILQKYVGDSDLTYKQVEEKFGSFLITTSTDVGMRETIYRSPETSPDLPIKRGIRESASIPIFYCPVRADGTMYVDGGLLNNYPIRKLYEYLKPEEVFGCKLISKSDRTTCRRSQQPNLPRNLTSYVKLIITMLHDLNLKAHVDEEDWKRTIKIDVGTVSATDFDISKEGKLALIGSGEAAARKFFDYNL